MTVLASTFDVNKLSHLLSCDGSVRICKIEILSDRPDSENVQYSNFVESVFATSYCICAGR